MLCACLAAAASSVGAVHSWPTGGTKAGGSGRIAERAHLPRRPLISTALLALSVATPQPRAALAAEATVRMEGLRGSGKSKTSFSDFTSTESGLQFKDYKAGNGAMPKSGDRVVIDWTGVTVGYQGRYFQTRNKPKGGAFEGDGFLDFLSFTVGDGSIIPAIDEAVRSMVKRTRNETHLTSEKTSSCPRTPHTCSTLTRPPQFLLSLPPWSYPTPLPPPSHREASGESSCQKRLDTLQLIVPHGSEWGQHQAPSLANGRSTLCSAAGVLISQ